MEIGRLANGREVMYFAATSEHALYTVEMLPNNRAMVRLFASEATTPKNVGFPATTGVLNSPDNIAQDALGNIYIIEDAPNSSTTGGDVWFVRDVDDDGVAESLDHFLSNRASGSESTGMIFNPQKATQFVLTVMHPDSTDLDAVPDGFGDAIWEFDVSGAPNKKVIHQLRKAGKWQALKNRAFTKKCKRAMKQQMHGHHGHR
jgi:hypothetical protein